MKNQSSFRYIVALVEALDRGEVFDVDTARLPEGWRCECRPVPAELLGEAGETGTHWSISVGPKDLRPVRRRFGKLVLTCWRAGNNSYTLIAPKALMPACPEYADRLTIEAA